MREYVTNACVYAGAECGTFLLKKAQKGIAVTCNCF